MDKKQAPLILDGIVQLGSSLLKSGSNHGVTADNIDSMIDKIGLGLMRYTGDNAPAAATAPQVAAQPAPAAPAEAPPAAKAKTATPTVTSKKTAAATPATPKRRGRPPKAATAAAPAQTVAVAQPEPTPAPAPAAIKRGRKPKAATTPTVSEPVAAAPAQPEKRKRGRPPKARPVSDAQASLPLATTAAVTTSEAAPEATGTLSSDLKSPNYRFKNLLKNGKVVTWNGMKPEDAYNGEMIACMVCGAERKMLKKHLRKEHGMEEADYLHHFGLPEDYKLCGPDFSGRKSLEAKATGLGKNKTPKVKATPADAKKTRARAKALA